MIWGRTVYIIGVGFIFRESELFRFIDTTDDCPIPREIVFRFNRSFQLTQFRFIKQHIVGNKDLGEGAFDPNNFLYVRKYSG